MEVIPPLYLIGKKIPCWKCGQRMSAVALLAPKVFDEDETQDAACIISGITGIPEDILMYIQSRVPTFKMSYSQTVGDSYLANTCPKCDTLSGDFYLHSEPGGPFFPESEDEARQLYVTEIPTKERATIFGNAGYGPGDMILEHAQRIA